MNYLDNAVSVIDKWIAYKKYFDELPSFAIGIVHGDKMIFNKAYGFANIASKSKATPSTNYRIASITKTFTAIAIMQLAEKGKLQLDDKVQKYLPWFYSKDITIRQLLSHSSGISRDGITSHWSSDIFPNTAELQKGAFEVLSPLTRFKYSNVGFAVLGEIVSKVSGIKYSDFIEKNILKPLKMTNTYTDFSSKTKSLATGYGIKLPGKEREVFKNSVSNAMESAAGIISNTTDMCKFMSAQFMGAGTLLSDTSKKEMQRVQWARKGKDKEYGLGLEVWEVDGVEIVGHGGGFQGFTTNFAISPKDKIGIFIATNATHAEGRRFTYACHQIINYCKKQKIKDKKLDLKKYEGLYSSRWGEFQIVDCYNYLLGFEPSSDYPAATFSLLEQKGDKVFEISETDEYDAIGETVIFETDKNGVVTGLKFGPNPMKKIDNIDS